MKNDRDLSMERLLDEIRADVRQTAYLTGRAVLEARVVEALRRVPRHAFVPEELELSAYANHPLPIGHGQTISQPYIVALMTDLVRPRPDHVMLEVGTGSGYQAAVLAGLVKQVYSVEIVEALARQARERLSRLGYGNVEVRVGDGHDGWPEHAPYDGILVTAAAESVPPALMDQLRPGGNLVIPVGRPGSVQQLRVIHKQADGGIHTEDLLPVAFVPLTGGGPRDGTEA
ncbi:MAG TPA: protein-L-isoaspartate(D-aspartate) O-methyltransferase [Thiobacillaceae bacterium]|nr:protein-L-isoaspartate(D-aspartate) O-methyltransferase [Thiobacillaceae bacterium]HNU64083.1 protein-L-isoaspartate(D-aspartate) O-methyltransferase [Thiobacillaceae bacterium]